MGEVVRRNVPLRGWQRADLSNGEEAMIAERKGNSVLQWKRSADGSGPKAGGWLLASVISAAAGVPCCFTLFAAGVDKRVVSSSIFFLFMIHQRTHVSAPST